MKTRGLIAAGLAAALLSGGALALAQAPAPPGPPGPGPGMHRGGPGGPGFGGPRDFGLRGIDLSDAQREQVKSIRESHKDEFQQIGQKMRQAHEAFAQATEADTLDEAAVRARSTAVASAMADEAILRAKVRTEINAILTPEQLEQLKTRQQQMNNRRPRG